MKPVSPKTPLMFSMEIDAELNNLEHEMSKVKVTSDPPELIDLDIPDFDLDFDFNTLPDLAPFETSAVVDPAQAKVADKKKHVSFELKQTRLDYFISNAAATKHGEKYIDTTNLEIAFNQSQRKVDRDEPIFFHKSRKNTFIDNKEQNRLAAQAYRRKKKGFMEYLMSFVHFQQHQIDILNSNVMILSKEIERLQKNGNAQATSEIIKET